MRRRLALFLITVPVLLLIGWAAAGAALAGGGCHGEDEAAAVEGATATVTLTGCTFGPAITRVAAGTEVKWINAAGQTHDVVGRRYAWGSEALENGQSFSHRFAAAGLYPYSCSFHPGMAGVVVVGTTQASPAGIQAAAAIEAADGPTSSADGTIPAAAAAVLGLVGGLVVAGVGMRLMARRDTTA